MFNQFCRSFAGSTLADIKVSLLIVDVELLAPNDQNLQYWCFQCYSTFGWEWDTGRLDRKWKVWGQCFSSWIMEKWPLGMMICERTTETALRRYPSSSHLMMSMFCFDATVSIYWNPCSLNILWNYCSASPSDNIIFMQNIYLPPLVWKNIRQPLISKEYLIFFEMRGRWQMFCIKLMLSEGDALQSIHKKLLCVSRLPLW